MKCSQPAGLPTSEHLLCAWRLNKKCVGSQKPLKRLCAKGTHRGVCWKGNKPLETGHRSHHLSLLHGASVCDLTVISVPTTSPSATKSFLPCVLLLEPQRDQSHLGLCFRDQSREFHGRVLLLGSDAAVIFSRLDLGTGVCSVGLASSSVTFFLPTSNRREPACFFLSFYHLQPAFWPISLNNYNWTVLSLLVGMSYWYPALSKPYTLHAGQPHLHKGYTGQ